MQAAQPPNISPSPVMGMSQQFGSDAKPDVGTGSDLGFGSNSAWSPAGNTFDAFGSASKPPQQQAHINPFTGNNFFLIRFAQSHFRLIPNDFFAFPVLCQNRKYLKNRILFFQELPILHSSIPVLGQRQAPAPFKMTGLLVLVFPAGEATDFPVRTQLPEEPSLAIIPDSADSTPSAPRICLMQGMARLTWIPLALLLLQIFNNRVSSNGNH